jgi:hypothetical protein
MNSHEQQVDEQNNCISSMAYRLSFAMNSKQMNSHEQQEDEQP